MGPVAEFSINLIFVLFGPWRRVSWPVGHCPNSIVVGMFSAGTRQLRR